MRKRIIRKLRRSISQEQHGADGTYVAMPQGEQMTMAGVPAGATPGYVWHWQQQQQQVVQQQQPQPYVPVFPSASSPATCNHQHPQVLHQIYQPSVPFTPPFLPATVQHQVPSPLVREEEEVIRAIEESKREEEQRRRWEEEQERLIQMRLREEEEVRRLSERQAEEEAEEERKAAIEEARLLHKAIEESLANHKDIRDVRDAVRAEGTYDLPVLQFGGDPYLSDEVSLHRRSKHSATRPLKTPSSQTPYDDDDELADALRLSQLITVPVNERPKEEEAIYRAALIHQQDREYEESLEKDRLMERAEKKRQERIQRASEIIEAALAKGETLPVQPAGSDAKAVSDIAVRMPDGTRARRLFSADDLLRTIYDWVDYELAVAYKTKTQQTGSMQVNEDVSSDNIASYLLDSYELVADFPRRTFTAVSQTAREAGLFPRALLNLSRRAPDQEA